MSAEERLKWNRHNRYRIAQAVLNKLLPEAKLIEAKTSYNAAETALREAERRRDQRKAKARAEESRIDMEAGGGGGKDLQGIYRLKDNILTICYDEADRGWPETFAASKPSERLIILRRWPEVVDVERSA